jgi:hypothetical protein
MARVKARYKLDSVVELTASNGNDGEEIKSGFGRVTAITQSKGGFTYTVEGYEQQIEESWIASSYNQSKPRGSRTIKTTRKTGVTAKTTATKLAKRDSVQETTL